MKNMNIFIIKYLIVNFDLEYFFKQIRLFSLSKIKIKTKTNLETILNPSFPFEKLLKLFKKIIKNCIPVYSFPKFQMLFFNYTSGKFLKIYVLGIDRPIEKTKNYDEWLCSRLVFLFLESTLIHA